MKKILKIIRTTIIGGLFFLAPLVILSIIIVKAFEVVNRLTAPLVKPFADARIGGELLQNIVDVIVLLLVCLLAGLFASTKFARRIITYLERHILQYIPGYLLFKNMAENTAGIAIHEDMKVALIRTDAGWQLAFLIEKINDSLFVVFAPDAPSGLSGTVIYAEKEHIRFLEITTKEARQSIHKFGIGSAALFKDKLPAL